MFENREACLLASCLALTAASADAGIPQFPELAARQESAPPTALIGGAEVVFRFEPVVEKVALGHDILFRGAFLAVDPQLLSRLRVTPVAIPWRVVKRGTAISVLQGEVRLQGPRTVFEARTRPAEPGEYELIFMVAKSLRLRLRLEYDGRNRIEVYTPAATVHPKPTANERRQSN